MSWNTACTPSNIYWVLRYFKHLRLEVSENTSIKTNMDIYGKEKIEIRTSKPGYNEVAEFDVQFDWI
jgi:hypothetical protein